MANNGTVDLLDGDQILVLLCCVIKDITSKIIIQGKEIGELLSMGAIQTNYANGASSLFIQNKLKVKERIK